jgi:hypothetical protein
MRIGPGRVVARTYARHSDVSTRSSPSPPHGEEARVGAVSNREAADVPAASFETPRFARLLRMR